MGEAVNWRQFIKSVLIILLATLLLAWGHYQFVVTPLDFANKDFMSLWTGAKAVLRNLNPYDVTVWEPLRASYGSSWMPDPRAPFPLWTFIFTAPFALFPIPWGAALWLSVSELLLAGIVYGFVRRLRLSPIDVGLLILGCAVSIVTLLVLINGQITIFLLLFLSLFLFFERQRRPFLAGLILSFIIIKPNPFIAFVPLIGLWLVLRKKWAVIAGGAVGALGLAAISWALQPGWVFDWMNVREKTSVSTITPTIWGLAGDVAGGWWLPVGVLLAIALVAGAGWFIFTHPELSNEAVLSLAIPISLLTTPYTWVYEHALLYIPWLWLYVAQPRRRAGQLVWVSLALLIPWILFFVAAARDSDSLAFISPALALAAVLYTWRMANSS